MATAKSIAPVQLEIGESVGTDLKKIESPIQLEIAGIVEKYADAAAEVQKGTVGGISKLQREMTFGAMVPTVSEESPYEALAAGEGAVTLALKEDPSQNEDVKVIMARYKQASEFERIPSMPTEQRRKLMEYYKKAKEAGVKDRLIATGMGSIVLGYSNIEAVRTFVQEYQKTGKMGRHLPLPYVSFTNAAEKFPEAQVLLASELEATKKMDEQIKSILDTVATDAKKQTDEYRQSIKILEKLLNTIK